MTSVVGNAAATDDDDDDDDNNGNRLCNIKITQVIDYTDEKGIGTSVTKARLDNYDAF